jgi:hypothetical protein
MIKRVVILELIIGCILANAFSQSSSDLNPIPSTVPFLIIAPDSRAGAMGDVGAATIPDASSQHWNASKYAFINGEIGFAMSFTPWLRNLVTDINLGYVSGYLRIDDRQVVSASFLYFSLGEILFRDRFGDELGNFTPNELAFDAAYSRKFSDNLSSALTLRFLRSDLTGGGTQGGEEYNPGISFGADLSTYYQKDIKLSDKSAEYAWGVAISNLGSKISYTEGTEKSFIPANLRVGGRISVDLDDYNSISLAVDLNKLLVPTPPIYFVDSVDENGEKVIESGKPPPTSLPLSWIRSFYDAPDGFKEEFNEIMYSIGAEYWYREQFAIRAGYFYEHESKGNRKYFTAGIGLRLNVFFLDFSYLMPTSGRNNPLANTMRFSLGFIFDKFKGLR